MQTMTPTPTQAAQFFEAAQDTIARLWDRWQDERGYEDLAEYAAPLRLIAARFDIAIEKMTARPFGCVFVSNGKRFLLAMTARSYRYLEIR